MLEPLAKPLNVTPLAIIAIELSANCNLSAEQLSSIPKDVNAPPTVNVPETSQVPFISIAVALLLIKRASQI